MNIQNALKIQGWMQPAELEWLAKQASTRKLIVEVGSWLGRSTRAMADNLQPGAVLYAVDTWEGTPGPGECAERLIGKPKDWLLQEFIRNIGDDLLHRKVSDDKDYIYTVRPHQAASVEGARYLCGGGGNSGCYSIRPDMIFLDAGHNYEDVKADLEAWAPYLAPGGLLCGHDFGGSFPGVSRAVREKYPTANKVGAGSIWAV